ncbi:GNAT family N-acetyltransferase [Streptosporangium sp. NPDC002524]|uniref:GNAT family N-acetyltransferase n=1 Tax=Streptosporangium sp. NPDC002524 TaxID=3154537 RepID=UPI003316A7A0
MMRTQLVSPDGVPAPGDAPPARGDVAVVRGDVAVTCEDVAVVRGDLERVSGGVPVARRDHGDRGDHGPIPEVVTAGSGDVVTVPGGAVEIRPARPDDDEEAIRRFLGGLSPRTQALRFFAGMGRPSASFVRTLLAVDERRDALLAVHGNLLVGHAMSYRGEETDVEIAVVVGDEWQGMGLGSRLVRALMRRAEVRGARTVGMDVLGDNRTVLAMVRRAWPEATMRVSSGTVEVTATVLR